jgi:ribosomal-protein-alanine N-acetyltransferase
MKTPPLSAGNLVLEPVTRAHAAELLEPLREPSLYEFVDDEPPQDEAALEQRLASLEAQQPVDGDGIVFAWVLRTGTRACGLLQATCNDAGQAFIGYEVFEAFRRQGLARAAVATVLEFLECNSRTSQVLAYVDTRNEASIRMLQSLGFSNRRRIDGAAWFACHVSDEFEFELLFPARF